jgi:hypothetical protein
MGACPTTRSPIRRLCAAQGQRTLVHPARTGLCSRRRSVAGTGVAVVVRCDRLAASKPVRSQAGFPGRNAAVEKSGTGLSLIAGQGVLGQQHGSPVIRLHETQGSLLSRIPGMLLCCVKRRNDGCEALQDMEALAGDVAFEAADNLAL